jgi:hypothetical protein
MLEFGSRFVDPNSVILLDGGSPVCAPYRDGEIEKGAAPHGSAQQSLQIVAESALRGSAEQNCCSATGACIYQGKYKRAVDWSPTKSHGSL